MKNGSESFAGFEKQTIALCNSKGLDLYYTFDYSQLGLLAVVKEGDEMYNGFEIATDDFSNFDLNKITEKAVEEAVSLIGNDSVDSGTYDIVLSNKMMATLLSTFFSIFSAEDAQKGLSLLNGKEGETIASRRVGGCHLRIEKGVQEWLIIVHALQTVSLMRLPCIGTEMVCRGLLHFNGVCL